MIIIALGSNLPDREQNIKMAIEQLVKHSDIYVEKVSSLYETEPVGIKDQPVFLNAIVCVKSGLQPVEIMKYCLEVEKIMGRKRIVRWGPRNIDIDLLVYDDIVINTEELQLPHPRMCERRFVLEPLEEILPKTILPCWKTATELIGQLTDVSAVKRYEKMVWNGEKQAFV